ncbi:cell wall anchor protein [Micromonospora sp. S-DT3-3-22]|uniref:cell wall anchor protein n=1 Tax=Micromonospora sp. S-DT3-3-22 TaxID=2755359 RepID=UPI00188E083E|nr:cell wall anchor protein [Micromonospora sp. S-DT3-3-22]
MFRTLRHDCAPSRTGTLMRKHTMRRWLAGFAAVGAFVTASTGPALAAPAIPGASPEVVAAAGFDIVADSITLAPGGSGRRVSLVWRGDQPPLEHTVTVDYSAVDAFADVRDPLGSACTRESTVLTCSAIDSESHDLLLIPVLPRAGAKVGQNGKIRFTVTSSRFGTSSTTSTVTIGEGVDLVAGPAVTLTGGPGATVPVGLSVGNQGQETAQGAVLLVSAMYGLTPSKRYQNCRYGSKGGLNHWTPNLFVCTFDDEIAPGRVFRVGGGFGVTVPGDVSAPNIQTGTATWLTPQDWADERPKYTLDQQGTGGVLRLEPTGGKLPVGASRAPQTDVKPADNETPVELTVTGDQRADLAADEVRITAKVGETVPVTIGYTNRGPASSSNGGRDFYTIIEMTVPKGVTAVKVPKNCLDADIQDEEGGRPGARAYSCYQYDLIHKGGKVALPFSFRIDRAGTLTGKVELSNGPVGAKDLDPSNDTAKILVNPTSGGQGGDDGSLPITGSPTGLLVTVGGLLLVAGIVSYLAARRLRSRFVA